MGFRFICYKSLWDFERFLWNLAQKRDNAALRMARTELFDLF